MNPESYVMFGSITVFVLLSMWLFVTLHIREQRKREALDQEPLLSQEVRDASHKLANEATKLRTGLRQMADSPDPIKALVRAMTGRDHERHN